MIEDLAIADPGCFIHSDHSPITVTIKANVKRLKPVKRSVYNYKNADWQSLNYDLNRVDWEQLLNYTDIHDAWCISKTKLTSISDLHIPKIKIGNSCQPPWFDAEVFRLNKKKERFRKLFKQTKSQYHYSKYSNLRKSLKALVKTKMTANFDDELSPNAITKKFWSYVKSFSKTGRIPEKMYLGNCLRNNSKDIAELFNQHFFNQFSDESSYNVDIDFSNDYFLSFSISTNTIYQELIKLNTNKSTGPDEISGTLLKNCALSIAYPSELLFNLSFKTGSLPLEWKLAHIVPVHKKGDKSNIENYRPSSLTCIISKIFEKSVRDALLGSCQDYIHDTQHEFLPQKSCTAQLVPFSHDISLGLNENKLIDVIYFDSAKAFDSVNHDIILNKIKNKFNVNGLMLKFVKEYLHGRK